ncbi:hypothetical protein BDN70DRAFT_883624 [Pholiota conissans]|uniref:MYND-type domain-containing protein n=1 Tax=Pholiota conissans TaxID=109636 RepID=A0A9P5YX78_9AGAR|nr:hypothetical protein BDN70DRAFT_883624 [Pholiota conissans]
MTTPSSNENTVLDLHDIALLLNYERASTEPRFRYTKLREVAQPGQDFRTILTPASEWHEASVPRTGFVFEKSTPKTSKERDEPDLPTNMLAPSPSPAELALTSTQLETYYWQARNHDGCFAAVALFQNFMDLFPASARIRVRTLESPGKTIREYTSSLQDRCILEFNLINPRSMNMSVVLHNSKSYLTGCTPSSIHAVIGFAEPGSGVDVILDLASLQFGDVGRGFRGKGLFVLEPVDQYENRLDKFAEQNTFQDLKMSTRINTNTTPNNDWLKEVTKRAKRRWDNRHNAHWCGHCGAPPRDHDLKRCGRCRKAWYCNAEHQGAAWPFHKHFCADGGK